MYCIILYHDVNLHRFVLYNIIVAILDHVLSCEVTFVSYLTQCIVRYGSVLIASPLYPYIF